jgi:hypothetical protein
MTLAIRRPSTEMGRIMKRKILALGLLSLCSLAMFAGESKAFLDCLSPYHPCSLWNRHNRYVTQITCRPYNAFTPICWGNLVCDGCCPPPCGVASGCCPMPMGVPPWASCGPQMGMGGGYAPPPDFSRASDMPYAPGMQPMPDIRSTPFTPPMPMPLPSGPNISMYPYQGVSQANYNPYTPPMPNYYMPVYNPYQGWQQPMPYYWYQGR